MRAADLRFGPAEASAFLQGVMGLELEASAITILESRTEGWIAGLQCVAICSKQSRCWYPNCIIERARGASRT